MMSIDRPHPGIYIKDAIEALGMTSKEFSARTGISERVLSGIITGACDVSFETAYRLSEFFDNSINFWTNLQNQYNVCQKVKEEKKRFNEDFRLVKSIKDYLIDCGFINEDDDDQTIVQKARKIAGVNELSLLNSKDLLVCFKEQNATFKSPLFYQNFWIALSLNEARKKDVSSYNREKLICGLKDIPSMTLQSPNVFYKRLENMFNDCGISFVLLPYLSKSNIYGVTKWLGNNNVMLAVSDRGKQGDLFWFTICHEIAHVLMGHKREALLFVDGVEDKIADEMAADILIPRDNWRHFVNSNVVFDEKTIIRFARENHIHPRIVLGRLHKEKKLEYGVLDKAFPFPVAFQKYYF